MIQLSCFTCLTWSTKLSLPEDIKRGEKSERGRPQSEQEKKVRERDARRTSREIFVKKYCMSVLQKIDKIISTQCVRPFILLCPPVRMFVDNGTLLCICQMGNINLAAALSRCPSLAVGKRRDIPREFISFNFELRSHRCEVSAGRRGQACAARCGNRSTFLGTCDESGTN